jgi:aminoglycoside phosphotransferase (APT) family kinase protein
MLAVDAPDSVRAEDVIDRSRLFSYLKSHVDGLVGDGELLQFHAGHSNLTYLVKFANRELVIKRSPPGQKAKSAHDMGREFKVLSRLHGHYPFAPRAFAYCEDASIAGSPFCVMERATGVIIRSQHPAGITPEQIALQFAHLIDGLADLHSLSVAEVGLADFGRPAGYRQRQAEGWAGRLEAARTDDLVDFAPVTKWLADNMPREPERAAVVHNDFKLDNLVWDSENVAALKAVLDWEMSTVGDPILDLACTMSFWLDPTDPPELRALRAMPTLLPGVLSRSEAIHRYVERAKHPIQSAKFLLCFGYLRRAAIEQQKYVRYRRGETTDQRFSQLNASVKALRDTSLSVINGDLGA